MRFIRTVARRIGRSLLAVLLAAALILPTGRVASAVPGTLALLGMDLDAVTIPELHQRMQAGGLTAVELTQTYMDPP
jgi:amidase